MDVEKELALKSDALRRSVKHVKHGLNSNG